MMNAGFVPDGQGPRDLVKWPQSGLFRVYSEQSNKTLKKGYEHD
jgi:hypothetical protein